MCPFFKKDMSKVCHTCVLWDKTRVQTLETPRKEYDHWDCTYRIHTIALNTIVANLDGVQQATESFRNTAWNESQKNLEALIGVVNKAETAIAHVKTTKLIGQL